MAVKKPRESRRGKHLIEAPEGLVGIEPPGERLYGPLKPAALQLCLDLGMAHTGYAVMVGDQLIEYGLYTPRRASDAESFYALRDKIEALYSTYEEHDASFQRLVIEGAFQQQGKAGEDFGMLAAACKVFAYDHGLPLYMVYPPQVKKLVAGHGGAKKPQMVRAVNERYGLELDDRSGNSNPDPNIADAIGVGLATYQLLLMGAELNSVH